MMGMGSEYKIGDPPTQADYDAEDRYEALRELKQGLPEYALSIMQPWAWLIVNGHKDVENRDWQPWNHGLKFRGPVCIHAGKKLDTEADEDMRFGFHPACADDLPSSIIPPTKYERGGIVGVAEIVGVVKDYDSDWFCGPYGLILANPKPVKFIPCKGALGFFKWEPSLAALSKDTP